MPQTITYTETEITDVAKRIAATITPGSIYTFIGGLAAGKTTLIRSIMRELGYNKSVNSPTFVIEHRYSLENGRIKQVLHVDLYRLSKKDLDNFDWDEYSQKDVVTFVEWPGIAKEHLPKDVKEITIQIVNDKTRKITLPDNFER